MDCGNKSFNEMFVVQDISEESGAKFVCVTKKGEFYIKEVRYNNRLWRFFVHLFCPESRLGRVCEAVRDVMEKEKIGAEESFLSENIEWLNDKIGVYNANSRKRLMKS